MPSIQSLFVKASRLLYPKGRVWRMPEPQTSEYVTESGDTRYEYSDNADSYVSGEGYGGYLLKLHQALGASEATMYLDSIGLFNSIIADNPNFTMEDALEWYRRLGIIAPSSPIPLANMMAAINQKYRYPAGQTYRQGRAFIESQLRSAGFDVYVYANNFMGATMTPAEILGYPVGLAVYGDESYGDVNYGSIWADNNISIVANHIEEEKDANFTIPADNYRSTFYIAGSSVDTFANVSLSRKLEFRQLVMQLKSAQTIGILFVNFI